MMDITSEFAFWILSAWRRQNAQLHFNGRIGGTGGKDVISSGVIWWVSPNDAKFCILLFGLSGQKLECSKVSLAGAISFSFDPSQREVPSADRPEVWVSSMEIKFSDGRVTVIGERFTSPVSPTT